MSEQFNTNSRRTATNLNSRYLYIPLVGSHRKLLNIWVIFTFVAVWHDLEWKLLSWAWLTCLFFVPELLVKSAANSFQAKGALEGFIFRELRAAGGAIIITCLMVSFIGVCDHGTLFVPVLLFVNTQVKLLTTLMQSWMGEMTKATSMLFIQIESMNPSSGIMKPS
ncbi:membrane-bound O-acyltransferase GUP1-like [Hibiscus syriacus]|uniref:membrane-bound O-acyltransferase GUP1-like n=1 Tax=Hibiscus syriacus TaxID=106335 RepID=UPI001922B8BF|nr:membrane-bound O-acyltransferase GUP1-like [Hibiscus syriacus]